MTAAFSLRALDGDALSHVGDIDRSEFIDEQYRVEDGALVLDRVSIDSPGWSPTNVAAYVARARRVVREGGRAIGAWSGDRLCGFATVDTSGVGGDRSLFLLDMLYVSREMRGRGVGRALMSSIGRTSRMLGAQALYVSATPTRSTVEAYLHLGAELVAEPDPALLAAEPDDIHLRLDLAQLERRA